MTKINILEHNRPVRFEEPKQIPNTYKIIFPTKGWKQKVCTILFHWMKKWSKVEDYYEMTSYTKYEQVSLDLNDMFVELMKHLESINMIYRREAGAIIVGYDVFYQIASPKNQRFVNPMQIEVPPDYQVPIVRSKNGRIEYMQIRGIPVIVVPWVNGIFAIPKL